MTINHALLDELERKARAAMTDQPRSGQWFTVDPPWGDSTHVVSGSPDPHGANFVADCEYILEDPVSDLDSQAVAAHIAANSPDVTIQLIAIARAALTWNAAFERAELARHVFSTVSLNERDRLDKLASDRLAELQGLLRGTP